MQPEEVSLMLKTDFTAPELLKAYAAAKGFLDAMLPDRSGVVILAPAEVIVGLAGAMSERPSYVHYLIGQRLQDKRIARPARLNSIEE
jgi:hypothetical protein